MSDTFHVSRSYGFERQLQVYMAGLQGQRPTIAVNPEALEQQASAAMTPEAQGYLGGMGSSMRANREAFQRWQIVPRMLRDVSQRDLSVEILGTRLPVPFLLAPIGVLSIIHPEAELAVARAAKALEIPMLLSTASSKNMEEVASAMGETPHWFQLYWSKDFDLTASLVQRAEQAGYQAIVVTLDTTLLGWRDQDIQNAYLPFLLGQGLGNYVSDPVFRRALPDPPEENPFAAVRHFVNIFTNPALTWNDLAFLRQHTKLPILLKGILHPDDARRALDSGIEGIVVSNHGGRQVDGAQAALDALPRVVDAVKGQVPVLFDSGIRRASDIFKALALGARAVLLGRPYVWGLAQGGEDGVSEVLQNFLADLDLTLALSGHTSYSALTRDALVREP
ncbi:lactate 2-monooxygenase [Ktedonospora formicarum]|uniref:Oxidoreductase n=1 Tax=Ktedonospora formicarum TaxID=2778364 RepID=A0A8J3HXW4_9CHLR|nr:lactate 2-monooxygenase [Ktedonospora formicarum]GHO42543.1 oxidoreductase [Ktedonospora formicarum]